MVLRSIPGKPSQRINHQNKSKPNTPSLGDFIAKRDYVGALIILDFTRDSDETEVKNLLWVAYCAFHISDYEKAQRSYIDLISGKYGKPPKETTLYLACVYFYMQMYTEAEEAAMAGPEGGFKNRILYHIAQKMNSESKIMIHHKRLTESTEDRLSLAAMQYLRGRVQESTDIYKKLLIENRDDMALNVYVAMCYFKLDYYDVSLEILSVYLQTFPDSPVAVNLKACNHFRLYDGKAAEAELQALSNLDHIILSNDIIRHNMVVFSNGERALQVLPPLIDYIPEARLNLAIYYLRKGSIKEADDLLKEVEPSNPQEYILKAVVNASVGQVNENASNLRTAQTYFQAVGASPSECDTIPGRLCMASCFFLLKQFDDVNIYLNSVKSYMSNDDDFNWNYGISLAETGKFKAAEEAFLLVQDEDYKLEYCYIIWLSKCFIISGSPRKAWDLYLKMETASDSFHFLQLIANECYRMGHFLYAAKAFDVLEKIDPDPEFWEGKRGACVGVFQQIVASKQHGKLSVSPQNEESLVEVVSMLRATNNPQADYVVKLIRKWANANAVKTE